MKLLNLGCGNRYHPEWINLDFKSNNKNVQPYNLYNKLPFNAHEINAVYTSHVLEHFEKNFVPDFLKECYRILRKDGIIRIAVPDLEQLIKNYLFFLGKAKNGDKNSEEKYDWTMIEIFDQMVRNTSGGEMLKYWKQKPMPQEKFIIERLGTEVKQALNYIQNKNVSIDKNDYNTKSTKAIGEFRLSGEIHQWMYDEFSLARLLKQAGFKEIKRVKGNESNILNFNNYLLDIEDNGSIRKPDSLFMEAIKK